MMKYGSIQKLPGFVLLLFLWMGWAAPLYAGLPRESSLPVRHSYVNPAYTSSTLGWGVTHFQTLGDAAPGTAIHVAEAAALSVAGWLTLDGCQIDCMVSNGSFSITFELGSDVRMERNLVSGCGELIINSSDVFIRNCQFSGTQVQIGASATGAGFVHNILSDGAVLIDSGTATVTEADGWSNVGSVSNVWNRMSLEWTADGLPAGRTLDEDGLFIQPGDVAGLNLRLADLSAPVAGCELVAGYDGTLLTNGSLTLMNLWEYNLAESWDISTTGKLNVAIGLGLSAPLAGITEDGPVAKIRFQTLEKEGRAVLYFRTPDEGLWDNRLASNPDGTAGVYLTPFTVNSDTVTIDGTASVLQPLTIMQDETNLLLPEHSAVAGTVIVTLDAFDPLAGMAGASLSVSSGLSVGTVMESTDSGTNRYIWPVEITDETVAGAYVVQVVALDRSGNVSTNFAEFTVSRPPLTLTVMMPEAITAAFNLDVEILALDADGNELKKWTVPAGFLVAQASVELSGLPDDIAFLTADTAVSLRRKLPLSFVDGDWVFDCFSGDHALIGGDLNGDNAINSLDYLIFRTNFQSDESVADVNRDGAVNSLDFVIMRRNWQSDGE